MNKNIDPHEFKKNVKNTKIENPVFFNKNTYPKIFKKNEEFKRTKREFSIFENSLNSKISFQNLTKYKFFYKWIKQFFILKSKDKNKNRNRNKNQMFDLRKIEPLTLLKGIEDYKLKTDKRLFNLLIYDFYLIFFTLL